MRSLLFLLALLVGAVPALAQKPQADAKPAADGYPVVLGTWSYTVPTPQQTYEGTFTIRPTASGGYSGEFVTNAPQRMTSLRVDEASASFEFLQPGMGKITISGSVDDTDIFKGEASIEGGDPMAITATRESGPQIPFTPEEMTEEQAMAGSTDALIGEWSYTISPPGSEPVKGIFVLEDGEQGLTGSIETDEMRPIRSVEFDGTRLVIQFDQPGMGNVILRGTVSENTFTGEAKPDVMPGPAPMTATRSTD